MLQNCLPNRVRQKLRELPETLDGTYERILKEIWKADGALAFRILQCLTVASRPLRVEELAEVLALDFEEAEGRIPKFKRNWRLQDRQQALLVTCSSLITIVDDHGSRVVQFSHLSVKEFLTSGRLSTSARDISSFHILRKPAHTILAKACLAALLRLDDSISTGTVQSSFPLAEYAAEHWVDHAQFEKVSLCVEDGMQRLFDQSKPYFSAWLVLYDIDKGHPSYPHQCPEAPLYYASLCGFRDLAEHLLIKSPQDVYASGGRHHSPLAAALHHRHFHVAELLRQHGADIELAGYNNRTLLDGGHVDAVQWLLERGANVKLRQNGNQPSFLDTARGRLWTYLRSFRAFVNAMINSGDSPMHLALEYGRPEMMQLLIQHGADINTRYKRNSTLLHLVLAVRTEFVQFVIQADITDQDYEHRFLRDTTAVAVEALIQKGVDVNARDGDNSTPLHLALSKSHVDPKTLRLLLQHGADVKARDKDGLTPLHCASCWAEVESVQLLIQHGADVDARDKKNSTPLHLALSKGHVDPETLRLLLQHGADVKARDKDGLTPLHCASCWAGVESVQLLIQHGVDVDARDKRNSTPLHRVLSEYFHHTDFEILQLLLQHGADVNARNEEDSTPLYLALSRYHTDSEILGLLLQYEADVNARDKGNSTPLHLALSERLTDSATLQLLLQYGADVNARDKSYSTPLHRVVSSFWYGDTERTKMVRLLLEHGANADARDDTGRTPYEIALKSSTFRRSFLKIARLISEYRSRSREQIPVVRRQGTS